MTIAAAVFTAVPAPELAIDKLLYPNGRVSINGKLERRIVANLFAWLEFNGWSVCEVFDGEEDAAVDSANAAMELVFNLDEATLTFKNSQGAMHNVFLVLGEGIDMIADYAFLIGDGDGFGAVMKTFEPQQFA